MTNTDAIETEDVQGFTVEIHYDDGPSCGDNSPRDWDNGTHLVLSHRRYSLPCEVDFSVDDLSLDELVAEIRERYDVVGMATVRGYDHGALHMSIGDGYPFNDPWDAGTLGVIFMDRAGQEMCGTPDDRVMNCLAGDVETYSQWANGEVYGFVVSDPEGNVVDSCWGFIGDWDEAMSQGRSMAAWHAQDRAEKAATEEAEANLPVMVTL